MQRSEWSGRRLLWSGLLFVALALGFEALFASRKPIDSSTWELGSRRLGIVVPLSETATGLFGAASTALGLGCVVWAYLAARAAVFGPAAPSRGGSADAAEAEIGNRPGRLALAAVLFLACTIPFHMAIGWADGRVARLAHYNADWYRRALFRELALVSPRPLLWMAAFLALAAWLLRRPCQPGCERLSRAMVALARAPRKLIVAAGGGGFLVLALAYSTAVHGRQPGHVDAHAYLFQARTFLSGAVTSPVPGHADFLTSSDSPPPLANPLAFVGNRWFHVALPFGPALYALGMLAGCVWLVPPLLGTAAVLLTYVLAKDCYGPSAGLVALGLAVTCGWLVIQSGDYMIHLPCLVPMQVFMLATMRVLRNGSWLWAVGAGMALGLAVAARPVTPVGFCLPFVVAWAAWLFRSPRRAWVPTVALAAAFAVPVAGLLAYNAATTGHALVFGYMAGWRDWEPVGDLTSFHRGWCWRPIVGLANVLTAFYSFGYAAYHWPIPAAGAILATACVLGIWRGQEGHRWPVVLGLAGLAVVIANALVLDADPITWQYPAGPRHVFEALPILIVLGAGALVALHSRCVAVGLAAGRVRVVLAALVVCLVSWGTASAIVAELPKMRDTFVDKGFNQAVQAVPKPAIIFLPSPRTRRAVCQFRAYVWLNDPSLAGQVVYVRDLGERNRELAAAYPGRHLYRWDAQRRVLTPLGPDGVQAREEP